MRCQDPEINCGRKAVQRTIFAAHGIRFLCLWCWSKWMGRGRTAKERGR